MPWQPQRLSRCVRSRQRPAHRVCADAFANICKWCRHRFVTGTFAGAAQYFAEQDPAVRSFVVEPETAAVVRAALTGQEEAGSGDHVIQGGGYSMVCESARRFTNLKGAQRHGGHGLPDPPEGPEPRARAMITARKRHAVGVVLALCWRYAGVMLALCWRYADVRSMMTSSLSHLPPGFVVHVGLA